MHLYSDTELQEVRSYVDQRMGGMRVERYSWWLHWREIADYLLPRRYKWLITPNQGNRGSQINQRIIDSTGSIAHRSCAAGMMAGITSPARPWFRLTLEDDDMAEQTDIRLWLDEVAKRMLHIFAKSNFYNSIHVLYGDLAAFGTGVMMVYDDFEDILRCYNACAGEYFLSNSSRLQVDVLYREFVRTVAQIVDEWGVENCSDDVANLYKQSLTGNSSGLTTERIVLHAIEPNPSFREGGFGPRGMPYREVYWEAGSTKNKVLCIRGYHGFPAVAPRWDIVSNDPYGRGPGMDALGDLKQLQVEQKRKAQAIDKMVNPPLLADPSLRNEPMSLLPGGVTFVANVGTAGGAKPVYEVKPDLEKMLKDIEECQGRVERVFFKDLFLMISQLDSVRTATEIAARKEEKMLQLGPVLERFQNEALDPIINRLFRMMWRKRLIPPPPPELRNQMIKVEYTSVLAEAQRSVMTTGLERMIAFVGNIAAGQEGKGAHPDILDNIDWDEVVDEYAGMLGVPAKVIVPYAKVLKIRAQRQAQQQQAASAQNAMAAVQGAEVLSKTDVGGGQNALQKMVGGA